MDKPTKAIVIVTGDSVFDDEPDMESICKFVSGGNTLAKYCQMESLHFGKVSGWIKENKHRKKQYDMACACRDDWATQQLCGMVWEIASFDPAAVFAPDGSVLPVTDWPPQARAALSSIEVIPGTSVPKVKFIDRLKAIELIGRTRGMFAHQKTSAESGQTFADIVIGSMKKKKDEDV